MAREHNTIPWVYVGGCTDMIQVFDQGWGKHIKHNFNLVLQVCIHTSAAIGCGWYLW